MEYYSLIKNNTLSHHGIKGMSWGNRRAEWYPIDKYEAHLRSMGYSDRVIKKKMRKAEKGEAKYHDKTMKRDLALLTLLLGTGIRVSECVGLDIKDVDFESNGIRIVRKGGYESIVYFGIEVQNALQDYLEIRNGIIPEEGHEGALFLSMQNKRISVRAVENLVKKYASKVTSLKKITPHKLRSTYGTTLYQETGDIYLVADVLGHKDVNTTRKHYAAQADDRRRQAAKAVTLRKD